MQKTIIIRNLAFILLLLAGAFLASHSQAAPVSRAGGIEPVAEVHDLEPGELVAFFALPDGGSISVVLQVQDGYPYYIVGARAVDGSLAYSKTPATDHLPYRVAIAQVCGKWVHLVVHSQTPGNAQASTREYRWQLEQEAGICTSSSVVSAPLALSSQPGALFIPLISGD